MPEGDTIFRTARTLGRALTGRVVTAFETHLSGLAAVDRRAPLAGRTVTGVVARGKHVLIEFSGDLFLRTHMRMHGSWHIYRPGERWRAPRRDARLVVSTSEWIAIAFSVADAEFLTRDELDRHPRLAALGPDLLEESFDAAEARRRLRELPGSGVGDALLRQQAMAGVGNVYKSELLFLCRIDPLCLVLDLSDEDLDRIITRARTLMSLNVAERTTVGGQGAGRITTGRLNPREKLWVYDRAGKPCFVCGTPIMSASETGGRRTYWCPTCQAPVPRVSRLGSSP